MLTLFLSEFGGYLVTGFVALAAIFTVYFRGRKAGIKEERVEQQIAVQKQTEVAHEEVRDVEHKIGDAPDSAVRDLARSKWVRK